MVVSVSVEWSDVSEISDFLYPSMLLHLHIHAYTHTVVYNLYNTHTTISTSHTRIDTKILEIVSWIHNVTVIVTFYAAKTFDDVYHSLLIKLTILEMRTDTTDCMKNNSIYLSSRKQTRNIKKNEKFEFLSHSLYPTRWTLKYATPNYIDSYNLAAAFDTTYTVIHANLKFIWFFIQQLHKLHSQRTRSVRLCILVDQSPQAKQHLTSSNEHTSSWSVISTLINYACRC